MLVINDSIAFNNKTINVTPKIFSSLEYIFYIFHFWSKLYSEDFWYYLG